MFMVRGLLFFVDDEDQDFEIFFYKQVFLFLELFFFINGEELEFLFFEDFVSCIRWSMVGFEKVC